MLGIKIVFIFWRVSYLNQPALLMWFCKTSALLKYATLLVPHHSNPFRLYSTPWLKTWYFSYVWNMRTRHIIGVLERCLPLFARHLTFYNILKAIQLITFKKLQDSYVDELEDSPPLSFSGSPTFDLPPPAGVLLVMVPGSSLLPEVSGTGQWAPLWKRRKQNAYHFSIFTEVTTE